MRRKEKAMTSHFWITLAFGVLWIAGVWTLFRPEMIFGFLADWMEYFLRKWFGKDRAEYIMKPIATCPPCMSSLHGSYVWLLSGGSWIMLVPFCIALCGVNAFLFLVFSDE